MFKIGTFYKCFKFSKYQELEDGLRDHCIKRQIKGTIILTPEGINATVSSDKDKALEDDKDSDRFIIIKEFIRKKIKILFEWLEK